jgi:signal transduction histidine kinase
MSIVDFLRQLPYFEALPEDELDAICGNARELLIARGDALLEEGKPSDAMYVVVDGEFEVTRRSGERQVAIGSARRGEVLGEMSLLEGTAPSASARALVDSRVAEITRSSFSKLVGDPNAVLAMLRTVTHRLRSAESVLRQEEKMSSLGKLTAGLMHELNNPASAVGRGSQRLAQSMHRWRDGTSELRRAEITLPTFPERRDLSGEGALQRSDREEELGRWLEERGVPDPWEVAASLASAGLAASDVAASLAGIPEEHTAAGAAWIAAAAEIEMLAEEIEVAAGRVSEIVQSVKNYSRLDQAPIDEVDVHRGLDDTLRIFSYRLKDGFEVKREYQGDLPRIEAYAADLNQVWTNLIDNAIGAMGDKGVLGLRTSAEDDRVVIEISDTGPGVPEAIQPQIFDPFFTTKPPGEGTGLGLHTSYRIVARHGGDLRVTSEPGSTVFRVVLPQRLAREAEEEQA